MCFARRHGGPVIHNCGRQNAQAAQDGQFCTFFLRGGGKMNAELIRRNERGRRFQTTRNTA
jgi:hypothetical protein